MRTLHSGDPARVGADKTRPTERAATRFAGSRAKKFLSYYKPYRGLLLADLLCAVIISAAALLLPVCTNFITKNLLAKEVAHGALDKIYALGAAMLALVALQALCTLFVDYQGHVMGAKMERDMRLELFEHYQKLSFSFYDRQRTGQLMARITNDLPSLAELYHHGPEDLAIAALELIGVLVILAHIDQGKLWQTKPGMPSRQQVERIAGSRFVRHRGAGARRRVGRLRVALSPCRAVYG